ncbi:MFS transporter [Enterovibrio coralii]|uniref:MFS transporter permease n=1 Tax=Enterovibrio coralii TaxID=294935 RepID=A0A135I8G7_9GAMM|nr:MFS transporter [Enterovibrio coralii]KXF81742.1 MFS transporter permease [Enterovibrio coralii]
MIELSTPEYRRAAFALAFGSFLVFCNLYLFQPMLPIFAESYSVSATKVNWLLAASTLGLSVSMLPWALLSERFGRRPVITVSLIMMPLVGFLSLFLSSFWGLVALRGLMGIALAGFVAVAVAYMADEFSPTALVVAVGGYISANSLGGIVGRLSGGFMSEFIGWHGAVIAMAIFTTIGGAFVYMLLPKQQHFKPTKTSLFNQTKSIVTHLRTPVLWVAMVIGGLNFALFVNIYSVTTFRLLEAPFYLPVSIASAIFICYLAGTFSSRLSGRWANRYSPISGMYLGTSITLLGVLVSAIESEMTVVLGLLIVSGGAFFTHSLAYGWVSRKAKQAKAAATALYLVHYYIGGSLGGFYLIGCWEHGGWTAVTMGAVTLGILTFFLIHLLNVKNKVDIAAEQNIRI